MVFNQKRVESAPYLLQGWKNSDSIVPIIWFEEIQATHDEDVLIADPALYAGVRSVKRGYVLTASLLTIPFLEYCYSSSFMLLKF